ncbi:homo-oligomeric flavin containing cys decarboxylase family [Holotrichia oblita]|uniref:Homo-oligomeric flavin containing cys decarboxylase family n=1 Tax=Holotrichia oblita TaxID=644536 RepID=A0ACB9TWH7_HOLOL|nr:homo-oligomeric flavin containing cys decarboxylase family [Holotrichia oblita]
MTFICFKIQVIMTNCAKHFCSTYELPSDIKMFDDCNEWTMWQKRGDPVLHIELGKWADIFLIAPLDANSLANWRMQGLCDNLLTCTARAWDISKPLILCPAMNTKMYNHPITDVHLKLLESWDTI